jgi:Domain of unknown function (4846)
MRSWLAVFLAVLIPAAGSAAAEPLYPWRAQAPAHTIADSFAPPDGFVRVATETGSFGEWLRQLPLAPDGTPVRFHDGREKPDQSEVAAVIDIDVGSANLQQCADAIIRLRAEYLFSRGGAGDLAFDFTSGARYRFQSYAEGVTPAVAGAAVTWRTGQRQGLSHESLRRWLDIVFTYAGTLSLSRELQPVPRLANAAIGDALVHGGSPGHAVLIVDLAVEPASGRKVALLAQGFMPAQSVHVLRNLSDSALSPWFALADDRPIVMPAWTLRPDELRRF